MCLSPILRVCVAAIASLALTAPLAAQTRLATDLARYEQDSDPVHKAGDDVGSLHTLEQYRDEIRHMAEALKSTGVDAEKKPAGFKELQISIRENVRRIDDLILSLPVDKRPFFREVRTDLVKTQNELIDALFPRKPDRNSKTPGS